MVNFITFTHFRSILSRGRPLADVFGCASRPDGDRGAGEGGDLLRQPDMDAVVKGPLAWEVVHPAKTAGLLSDALPHMHNRTIGARTRLSTQLRPGSYSADRSHFAAGETRRTLTGIGEQA